MFKYDIPYAKDGQMTLTLNGVPINVSKKITYLQDKMNAHRVSICKFDNSCPAASYEIIDTNGKVIFSKTFAEGETAVSKEPYNNVSKETIHYVSKNGFDLIADNDGNIKTDEELLSLLYNVIYLYRLPITNLRQASVQLATFKPVNKNQFVSLKGLGEKTYDKCGEVILEIIKKYINESSL